MSQWVRAGLTGFGLGLGATALELGLLAATALPDGRDLGLDRERELDAVALGAQVGRDLTLARDDVLVRLHAEGAESAAAQAAFCHGVSPNEFVDPGGWVHAPGVTE